MSLLKKITERAKSNKIILIPIGILIAGFILLAIYNQNKQPLTPKPPESSPVFPSPTIDPEFIESARQQILDDIIFSELALESYEKHPYTKELPIITDKYTIVFDYQKERIRIRLKGVEKEEVQNEISRKLIEIGVTKDTVEVYYLTDLSNFES